MAHAAASSAELARFVALAANSREIVMCAPTKRAPALGVRRLLYPRCMGRHRVLIVDDDAAFREVTLTSLAAAGYEVDSAEDGRTALAVLDRFTPELMLLDIHMPGMSGAELMRALGTMRGEPLPFIVVAVSASPARASPARWFLPKPVRLQTLLDVVHDFLGP